jgi:HD-GYP domain-containing protein (c-di-GMP phosphodiesterase class II)
VKLLNIQDVKAGMVLAESIFSVDGSVELLTLGSELSERQIGLIERLGIYSVSVYEESDLEAMVKQDESPSFHADVVEKHAIEKGISFDATAFREELEAIERENFEPVIRSIVNQNMEIHILTGAGNVPIDESHKGLIEETQQAFEDLKNDRDLDLDGIQKRVDEALPDMIRNNDVLMRLSQLRESDDYTYQHSFRVSILATMIGKWMGYDRETLQELATAGLMFDMGKMKIPEFIMKKPQLTEEEFEVVKKHAQLGYGILMKTKGITNNMKYSALQHHERLDGSGYPLRLKSGQIHEFAKIIMVCDIFDAMISDRPYRKKVSPFQAAEYLSWQSGQTLDSKICYILINNLAEFYLGKRVKLSTGEYGTIVYVDVNFPTRPVVSLDSGIIRDLVKEKDVQVEELIH